MILCVVPLGKGLQEGSQLKFIESLTEVIKWLLLAKKKKDWTVVFE